MINLRDRTLSGIGWTGLTQIVRLSLQLIIIAILSRLLSPTEFGLIGMIIVFTGFIKLINDLGLGSALIQKSDIEACHLNSVFWINILTGIALTIITMAIAPLIASFYNEPSLIPITVALSFNSLFGSVSLVQNALIRKQLNFRLLFWIETSAVVGAGILSIGFALSGAGVWSLVIQSLVYLLISAIFLWINSPWRPELSIDINSIKDLLGFSSNLLGFNSINYWIRNLDNLLVGKYIGPTSLGIYTRAYSLMLLPISQISGVLTQVMFPVMSTIQQDITRVKRVYLQSTRMIGLITFPIMIGLLVVAEPFILVLYGEEWQEVIPLLQLFCLVGISQSISTTQGWLYTSQGRTDIFFRWAVFAGIIRITGILIGLNWGLMGIAVAYLLGEYLFLWYPSWLIAGRLINMRVIEIIMNLSSQLLCAVAMGLAVWILGNLLPAGLPNWMVLAIQVSFGITVYALLIHIFRLRSYKELSLLISEQITKRRSLES